MSQNSKSIEKRLKAILYLAVFLTVLAVSASAKIVLFSPLAVLFYSMTMAIVFLFLILRYAPPSEIKRLVYITGSAIIIGVMIVSWSIDIVLILAAIAGIICGLIYYKLTNRLFGPINIYC